MRKDFFGIAIIILALFGLIYLAELNQRISSATEENIPVVNEINQVFKDFGFDYKVKLLTYNDLPIHENRVLFRYDKVYFPKSKLQMMAPEEIARVVLDVAPCQFTSSSFIKVGTKESVQSPDVMNHLMTERVSLSKEKIRETWNEGSIKVKTYSKNLTLTKEIGVDQANSNIFYYFDNKKMESSIKNNFRQVMIDSFSDRILVKMVNKNCPSEKL